MNQLATSTVSVMFCVVAPTVTGLANAISISAETPEVNVKSCVAPAPSVNTPLTRTLTPVGQSGCAVMKLPPPPPPSPSWSAGSTGCSADCSLV